MEPAAVAALICPVCAEEFAPPAVGGSALVCGDGHSFDVARQGYVNLLSGAGTHFLPDTAAMVAARDEFLAAGHYAPLAAKLSDVVVARLEKTGPGHDPLVVDAGTGTGYYLHELAAQSAARGLDLRAVAMDISKFALRRAARANPAAANVVWDLWKPLPLAAGCADAVMVVFAPRNAAEFARILRPGGTVVVVTPLPGHLAAVASATGMLGVQPDKEEALVAAMSGWFRPGPVHTLEYQVELDRADVARVALMGPAGHHLDADAVAHKVAELPAASEVEAAFRISEFELLPPQEWVKG
ncbi:putative RNA methyltransferase [Arthrobacter sp. 35W]|uniref:putative RNA methyltransferase n=1 Tax=Arthrobacter sp. 35W TaxID=1132441 RepID=UPI000427788C|nr:methyltransferase domain-containing protein [Arthrobacter sp. 35W]